MNAEAKLSQVIAPSIQGLPAVDVARQFFRDGEGLGSNPYERGTAEYEAFNWEMHKLHYDEFMNDCRG